MRGFRLAAAFVVLCLPGAPAARAADDLASTLDGATIFRVFLKDGTSLISYGELARVDNRVVFSMPTSASIANPPLHLVNIAAVHVDWERTTRYAESVRATHYLATMADSHYAMLTVEIGQTLNDLSLTTDPARRLEIVERARKVLGDWPAAHFNYKQAEISQMLATLDEAIAELRVRAGVERFDLSFVASSPTPPAREPLLPRPTPKEAIEQVLTAARLSDSPSERVSLMAVALAGIERDADVLPSDWRTSTRKVTRASIVAELETDRIYQTLTAEMLRLAAARARAADVRGIERLLAQVQGRDRELGAKRPEAVTALVASVEAELDAARRLRLERDRWLLRLADFQSYQASIGTPVRRLDALKLALEDIKALAGSTPATLGSVQRVASQFLRAMSTIVPPDEFRAAHDLLISAAQLADSAARIRREAIVFGNMARAWDASAAAAGALMLTARARTEMQTLIRLPQLSP
jgi:hypothetical protein